MLSPRMAGDTRQAIRQGEQTNRLLADVGPYEGPYPVRLVATDSHRQSPPYPENYSAPLGLEPA